MKRPATLPKVFFALLLSLLVWSCSKKPEKRILGEWTLDSFTTFQSRAGSPDQNCTDSSVRGTIEFSKNGTGVLNRAGNRCATNNVADWTFEWELGPEDDVLKINGQMYSIEMLNRKELVIKQSISGVVRHVGVVEYETVSHYRNK